MNLTVIPVVLVCLGLVWFVVTTLFIYDNLRRRGESVSFIWLRAMAPWYAFRYKEITKKERGKVRPLFYHWIISINSVLVLVVLAVIVHYL